MSDKQGRDNAQPSSDALVEVSKSSTRLEGLTLVLIFLTALLAVFEFPRFRIEIIQYMKDSHFLVELVVFALFVVLTSYAIWFRSEVRKAFRKVYGWMATIGSFLFGIAKWVVYAAIQRGNGQILAKNMQIKRRGGFIRYRRVFSLEDFRAVAVLVLISIIFLWLSYEIKSAFPAAATAPMTNLVYAMWVLFVGSILILLGMVYLQAGIWIAIAVAVILAGAFWQFILPSL